MNEKVWFDSHQKQDFASLKVSGPDLGTIQGPVKWVVASRSSWRLTDYPLHSLYIRGLEL